MWKGGRAALVRAKGQRAISPAAQGRNWLWEGLPGLDPIPEFPLSQLISKPSRPWPSQFYSTLSLGFKQLPPLQGEEGSISARRR